MTVYVDDMRARHRGMVMCHMFADTDFELHTMADRIGVARRWHQGDHYDICRTKRDHAITVGAIQVTKRQSARALRRWASVSLDSFPNVWRAFALIARHHHNDAREVYRVPPRKRGWVPIADQALAALSDDQFDALCIGGRDQQALVSASNAALCRADALITNFIERGGV